MRSVLSQGATSVRSASVFTRDSNSGGTFDWAPLPTMVTCVNNSSTGDHEPQHNSPTGNICLNTAA